LSSSEKQKEKIKVLRENNSSMTKILGNKENDVTNFLSSSKSSSQYNKERMDTFLSYQNQLQKPMFRNASEMKKLKAESLYREILQLSI
jgi:4-diphosphocytidyl-2C-methyl-D-erythritol kinase